MTEVIRIQKFNDVHLKLHCDSDVAHELNEYFTFTVPGAKFSPAYKNKLWDGKIRLFHLMRQTIYVGLLEQIRQFAEDRDYQISYTDLSDFGTDIIPDSALQEFIDNLDLPFAPHDYQVDALKHIIQNRRGILLSPTASGKSLIIFMISVYLMDQRVLIIVPNVGLVHQMASDFESYGCPPEWIHKIFSGQEKNTNCAFTITTWQSIYQLPKKWFEQYKVVIGDEAHTFKAKCLVSIMENLTDCPYKIGTTGTLDGTQTNKLVLEGLFGPIKVVTTTAELMEEKKVAQLKIKAVVLQYPEQAKQAAAKVKLKYKDELRYITQSKSRNRFIVNLTTTLKENTLVLFNFVDHGKQLFLAVKEANPQRDVFLVYGGVEGEERELIRHYAESHDNVIIVASYKTFSTGINIRNLHNIISASPSKSRVRVLQSIGRGLRKNDTKQSATLYDIADDLSRKSYMNNTLRHFHDRVTMYNQEKFDYKIYPIQLKGSDT